MTLAGVVAVVGATTGVAFSSVSTDRYDYDPGDTVQITGDGMLGGEAVTVDVNFPDGTLAQEDVVAAADDGTFADTYVVPVDAPYGDYMVVATGQQSQSVYTTVFDPSTITSLDSASVVYAAPLTLSGSVVHQGNHNAVPGADVELQQVGTSTHLCSTAATGKNDNTGWVSLDTVSTGSDGSFSDTLAADRASPFPPSPDGSHYYVTAQPSVGSYGFRALHRASAGLGNVSTSGCQTVTVTKARTSTAATLGAGSVAFGTAETISYTVKSKYGLPGNTMYGATSVTKVSGPGSLGCTPTSPLVSAAQARADGSGADGAGFSYASDSTTQFACTPTAVGTYRVKVHFADNAANDATHPDGNYQDSDSAELQFDVTGSSTVLPDDNQVTSSELCTFDVDGSTAGNQFRLIYTQDPNATTGYRLTASNPGQYYYNVLYHGAGNQDVTLTIPYPFVTQGAVPVHVYDGVAATTVGAQTCYDPSQASLLSTASTPSTLGLGSGGAAQTITVHVPSLGTGTEAYINVHLDYGLKGVAAGCTSDASNNATCTSPAVLIPNLEEYDFGAAYLGTTLGTSVQSENAFKKDPGIGGLVLASNSAQPLPNTKVQIYDGSKKLLGTVYTDQDGWYMWAYRYTGKSATFTINVPAYAKSQSATLKANGFLLVNFSV